MVLTRRRSLLPGVLAFVFGIAGCTALPFVASTPSLHETVSPVLMRQPAISQVWPGFWSAEQAFLVYEPGGDAMLYTPADPPPGFRRVEKTEQSEIPEALQRRLYRHEGVPPGLVGMFNTSYAVGDVTASAVNQQASVSGTLTTLFHETFHAYQEEHFSDFSDASPFVDAEAIRPGLAARAEVERRLLTEALQEEDPDRLGALAQQYLAVRKERGQSMPAKARAVETEMERKEGSATLVEAQATAAALDRSPERISWYVREAYLTPPLTRWPGSLQERMFRWRLYGTGAAVGLLLDRLELDDWRERFENGRSFRLLLAEAVHFDTVSNPDRLARRALDRFDYERIVRNGDELWGTTEVPTVSAFYDAPAHAVFVFPEALGDETGRFQGNFFHLADNLLLVEASLYNVNVDGFSLTTRDRDVLLDTRGEPRLTIALPELPEIEGVTASPTRLEEFALEAHGLEVQANRPVDVHATPDSIVVRLVPSPTSH